MGNVLEVDGFDDFFAKSDVVDVIKQIMMNYTNNKVSCKTASCPYIICPTYPSSVLWTTHCL